MGNLNFQADQNEKLQQHEPDSSAQDSPKVDDEFADDATDNSKFLWIAIVVVVIAGVGVVLYLLNRGGYLNGSKSKAPVTAITETAPSAPTPVTESKVTPPTAAPETQQTFALQVSAFRTQREAERFVSQLKKKGIEAKIAVGRGSDERKWFRVYTGSFDTRLKAIAAIENMKKKVGTDVWVVPAQ